MIKSFASRHKKALLAVAIFPWTSLLLVAKGIDILYHAIIGGCLGF